MDVLVTGASGFVGSHTTCRLVADGHRVRVLARDRGRLARALDPLGVAVADVVIGNMTDPDAVDRALAGCTAAVHLAAEVGVAGGHRPTGPARATADGARLVVGRAVELGCDPVVYASSVTVHLPSAEPVLTPASPLTDPLSPYAAQKHRAEEFVRDLQAVGAPVTSLVLGGVYGPVSPHLDASFAALMAALEVGMLAPDSGMGVVDVRDVAAAVAAALEPGRGPRRYLASGHYVTWEAWTGMLSEAVGRAVPYYPAAAADLLEMGRDFDRRRADGEVLPPLSEEAAVVMASGCPGDDSATWAELGVTWRPAPDTFRDTVAWLRRAGHLDGDGRPVRPA